MANKAKPPKIVAATGTATGTSSAKGVGAVAGGTPTTGAAGSAGAPTNSHTPGTALLQGANVVVRYYKVTEAQLDRLDDTGRDTTRAYAFAAFLGALGVDLIRDILSSEHMSPTYRGVWATAAVFCLVFTVIYGLRGRTKGKSGKSQIQGIKDGQDFTAPE